jgi:hypothetical protein
MLQPMIILEVRLLFQVIIALLQAQIKQLAAMQTKAKFMYIKETEQIGRWMDL